jgi:hypothetical protein
VWFAQRAESGSKPFGLWGVTNNIGADLRGHRRVRVRCADMGFIARVDQHIRLVESIPPSPG